MLIGIMSDSHDDMAQLAEAVKLFNDKPVEYVIHAGDLVAPFTFEALGNLKCNIACIFGNNDGDRVLLTEKSGQRIHVQPHTVTLDGKRFVVVHEPASVNALADSGHYDVVVYGHTHRPDIRKVAGTLVVNPGKVARLHKGESTCVVLDTKDMQAELVKLRP